MTPKIKNVPSISTSRQRPHRGHFALGVLLTSIMAIYIANMPDELTNTRKVYIPDSNDAVIETLATQVFQDRELKSWHERLKENPHDIEAATALSKRYLVMFRETGDPRMLGYAEAALNAWKAEAQPPVAVGILRAAVLQAQHRFNDALSELRWIIDQYPGNTEAWLMQATIQTVTGNAVEAAQSCRPLVGASPLLAITCLANARALQHPEMSITQLDQGLKRFTDALPEEKLWAYTLLGEMAARQNDAKLAEKAFSSAMAINPNDLYLLAVYADYLLTKKQYHQVVTLLDKRQNHDGLLLRLAIAKRQAHQADWISLRDLLAMRMDASLKRQDSAHAREHALFWLELGDDPAKALAFAQQNWAVQKEAIDMRILLTALARHPGAATAHEVLKWIENNQVQDPYLRELATTVANETPHE